LYDIDEDKHGNDHGADPRYGHSRGVLMQNITIAVSEAGSAQTRTFDYKVTLDGEVVSERKLSPVQTSQVREMAMQYLSLLQGSSGSNSSLGAKSYLPILGAGLFHLFLESGWQEFASKIPAEEGWKTDHQFVHP
jgi:hypothetical protein